MKEVPVEIIYGALAVAGGIARYLNSFVNGQKFRFSIFMASAVVAGFSGFMFALLGQSMAFTPTMIHIMAGVGGFFGDQTLKFLMEYVSRKAMPVTPDELEAVRRRTVEDKETRTQRTNEDTETKRQRVAQDKETEKQRE